MREQILLQPIRASRCGARRVALTAVATWLATIESVVNKIALYMHVRGTMYVYILHYYIHAYK